MAKPAPSQAKSLETNRSVDPLHAARQDRANPFTGRNRTKKHLAAILLAEDELSDEAIAAEVNIARSTLSEWKLDAEFDAIVGTYSDTIITASLKLPIAKKHERVRQLNELNESYWQIKAARAERYALSGDAPEEAATGMLVRQPKIAANGMTVVEWAFDKSLDSAIKETHKQAAQELGQWEESLSVNHGGTLQQEYVIVENIPWDDTSGGEE